MKCSLTKNMSVHFSILFVIHSLVSSKYSNPEMNQCGSNILSVFIVHTGTGKTLLARAVASQLDANFLKVCPNLGFYKQLCIS